MDVTEWRKDGPLCLVNSLDTQCASSVKGASSRELRSLASSFKDDEKRT